MRIAIATSDGHVSPRLDCADELLLVEMNDGTERSRITIDLSGWSPHGRGSRIAHMHVDKLVCGAVDRFDEAGLHDSSVELFGGVTGPLNAVTAAVVSGSLVRDGDYW